MRLYRKENCEFYKVDLLNLQTLLLQIFCLSSSFLLLVSKIKFLSYNVKDIR